MDIYNQWQALEGVMVVLLLFPRRRLVVEVLLVPAVEVVLRSRILQVNGETT